MKINTYFKKPLLWALLFFIILTCIFTFPLILNTKSYIPGFSSSDEPYGALWYFWWTKYAFTHHLDASQIDMVAVPFGQKMDPGYVYWNLLNKALILLNGPIFAYNIQILFSFLLTGLIIYLLAFYIFENRLAAIFSSMIFTFCPYHLVRSWQHLGLSFIQWMPLYIFTILRLRKEKSVRNALLAGIAFALVMAFDLYYAYFMFIVTIIFLIFDYLYRKDIKDSFALLKLFLITFIIILIVESPDIYYIAKAILRQRNVSFDQRVYGIVRPFEALFSQSAKPLSYLLPLVTHPFFGQFTEQFIGTEAYGDSLTEHSLYLGWVPLVLAFIAIKKANRRGYSSEKKFYFLFLLVLGLCSWLFSQPPWWNIFGIKVYMPSFFMYKIAPMFRAYCRFGIVLMLAVALLAGYGFKYILLRQKNRFGRIAVTCLFSVLVLFEFWNWPPYKVIDVSRFAKVYNWLKDEPGDFTIAEYPLETIGPNERYKFYQTKHQKRLINGTIPGTYANEIAKTITRLTEPNTAGILKWMGVEYVLVHKENYLNSGLIDDREELGKLRSHSGLRFVRSFAAEECLNPDIMCVGKTGEIEVYKVIAPAISPE